MTLNKKQQLNLLDLYSYEIKSRIALNTVKINPFRDLITKLRMEELELESLENCKKFADDLWEELRTSVLNGALYEKVLAFLKSGMFFKI